MFYTKTLLKKILGKWSFNFYVFNFKLKFVDNIGKYLHTYSTKLSDCMDYGY
jgi:hypothetical protein